MKRGTDTSIENLNQGFTHIFGLTFESKETIADYIANPTHIQKAQVLASKAEKVLTFDYKPTETQPFNLIVVSESRLSKCMHTSDVYLIMYSLYSTFGLLGRHIYKSIGYLTRDCVCVCIVSDSV